MVFEILIGKGMGTCSSIWEVMATNLSFYLGGGWYLSAFLFGRGGHQFIFLFGRDGHQFIFLFGKELTFICLSICKG